MIRIKIKLLKSFSNQKLKADNFNSHPFMLSEKLISLDLIIKKPLSSHQNFAVLML